MRELRAYITSVSREVAVEPEVSRAVREAARSKDAQKLARLAGRTLDLAQRAAALRGHHDEYVRCGVLLREFPAAVEVLVRMDGPNSAKASAQEVVRRAEVIRGLGGALTGDPAVLPTESGLRELIAAESRRVATDPEVARAASQAAHANDIHELARLADQVLTCAYGAAMHRDDRDEAMRLQTLQSLLQDQMPEADDWDFEDEDEDDDDEDEEDGDEEDEVDEADQAEVTGQAPGQPGGRGTPEAAEDLGTAWRAPSSASTAGR